MDRIIVKFSNSNFSNSMTFGENLDLFFDLIHILMHLMRITLTKNGITCYWVFTNFPIDE